jgi:HEAT repeat protein
MQEFSRCYDLKGLKPQFYGMRKLAEPNVSGELHRLGQAAVPAMIEIFLKTVDIYPLGTPLPGPETDEDAREAAEKARRAELRALKIGIVEALGKLEDRRAFRLLSEVLLSGSDDEIRSFAADAAALCGGDDSVSILAKLLGDKDAAEVIRASCARALGFSRKTTAADALKEAVSDESAGVRAGAVRGIARMASKMRWRLRGSLENPEILALRRAAANVLADRLSAEGDSTVRQEIVEALGRIAEPSVLARIRELEEEAPEDGIRKAAADAAGRISRETSSGADRE